MAKTYKLVTTLSDGTEINAGAFEVPDASNVPTYYQHHVSMCISSSSTLGGGILTFDYISTSSAKLNTWAAAWSALETLSSSNNVAVAGYFGSGSSISNYTLVFLASAFIRSTTGEESISLYYYIRGANMNYKHTTQDDFSAYYDAVSEIT